jgi:hypothetical protein
MWCNHIPLESNMELFAQNPTLRLWLKLKDRFTNALGWYLEKTEAPAKLKEFEFVDPETNETIYLSTGTRYSVLHVGSKRLFFHRASGVFDGTSSSLQDCVTNRLELGD